MMADGNRTYCGAYPIMYKDIKSVYCIPTTNVIMSVKYNLVKKKCTHIKHTVQYSLIDATHQGNQHNQDRKFLPFQKAPLCPSL